MTISQARFKWTDDKLSNLIKCLQEFKSSMEFRNYDSNADKVKLYESVRKSLAEIYEDETEAFDLASVSENPGKDLDDVKEINLTGTPSESKDRKQTNKKRIF